MRWTLYMSVEGYHTSVIYNITDENYQKVLAGFQSAGLVKSVEYVGYNIYLDLSANSDISG
jgi:hypothetical protein